MQKDENTSELLIEVTDKASRISIKGINPRTVVTVIMIFGLLGLFGWYLYLFAK